MFHPHLWGSSPSCIIRGARCLLVRYCKHVISTVINFVSGLQWGEKVIREFFFCLFFFPKYFPLTFSTLPNLFWHLYSMWLYQMRFQLLWDSINLPPSKTKCDTEHWAICVWSPLKKKNTRLFFVFFFLNQQHWIYNELLQRHSLKSSLKILFFFHWGIIKLHA